MELFHMLNPINHMRTPEGVERYRGEPYAVAADVYAHPMHVGRAGWTWYTGSAGWMYQAAIEALLGLRRQASTFTMNPCIPSTWTRYSLEWRAGHARYRITVNNPERLCRGVILAELDGTPVDPGAIPLVDDDLTHEVIIVLGSRVREGQQAAGSHALEHM
jgi:cyclic beta-1,2-glucan synthetase